MNENQPSSRPAADAAPSLPDLLKAAAERTEVERGQAAAVEYVTVTRAPG